MVTIECRTCSEERACPKESEHHRRTAFAWCNDMPVDDCPDYAPRLWRGVPGVLDLPSPLSGRCRSKVDDHRRRGRLSAGRGLPLPNVPARPAPLPGGNQKCKWSCQPRRSD
jgi:hypothetical protein